MSSPPEDVLSQAGVTSAAALVRYIKTSKPNADPSPIDVATAAWVAPHSVLFVPDKGLSLADWLVSILTPRAQPSATGNKGEKGKGKSEGKVPDDRLAHWELLTRILAAEPPLHSVLASRHAAALIRATEDFATRLVELKVEQSYNLARMIGPTLGALVDPSISAGATTATARERLPTLAGAIGKLLSAGAALPLAESGPAKGIEMMLGSLLASYLPAFAQASASRREAGVDATISSFPDCARLLAQAPPKQTGKRKRSSCAEEAQINLWMHAQSFIYDTLLLPETLRTALVTPEKSNNLRRVVGGLAAGTEPLSLAPELLTALTNRYRGLPVELPNKDDVVRSTMLQFLTKLIDAVDASVPERSLLLARTFTSASATGLYRPGPNFDGQGPSWSSLLTRVLDGSLSRLVNPGGDRASDLRAVHALWAVDSSLVSTHIAPLLQAMWLTKDADGIAAAEPLLTAVFDTARRARGIPQLTLALIDAAHQVSPQVPAEDVLASISVPNTPRSIVLRAEALQSLPAPLAVGLVQQLTTRQTQRYATLENTAWALEAQMVAQILHTAPLAPDVGGLQVWVQAYQAMNKFVPRVQQIKKVKSDSDQAVVRAALALWASADSALVRARSAMPPSPSAAEVHAADLETLEAVAQSIAPEVNHLHNIFKATTKPVLGVELANTLLRCATSGLVSDPNRVIISVLEALETPDTVLFTGLWHVVSRWASDLNRFPSDHLLPAARSIVKSWDGTDTKQQLVSRLTAGNAHFVELTTWRDAIVTATLEQSSRPVRDAVKFTGARHFPRLYWGQATFQMQSAARKADEVLINNGNFKDAAHIRELLAQIQTGDSLLTPTELVSFVRSANKAKDLQPSTALFVRSWVSSQAARGANGQTTIREARAALSEFPWVLYTFSAMVMRSFGHTQAKELLTLDKTSLSRAHTSLKSFTPNATAEDLAKIEDAVRDAAVSYSLVQGTRKDLALPKSLVPTLAIERAKSGKDRSHALDGLMLAVLELLIAAGRTDELGITFVLVREAVYLSRVPGQSDQHVAVLRAAVADLSQAEQSSALAKAYQAFHKDLAQLLTTEAPGLPSRVAARIDALVSTIVACHKSEEQVRMYMLHLLSTAATVCTQRIRGVAVVAYAFASGGSALVRAHHSLFDREHFQELLSLAAGLLSPSRYEDTPGMISQPRLDQTWSVHLLGHVLTALGSIMRQRRKVVRDSVGAVATVLSLVFPLLRINTLSSSETMVRPSWMGPALDATATVQVASYLSHTLESVTARSMARSDHKKRKPARSHSLAEPFAMHTHAMLMAYARSLLGVNELLQNPLDRAGATSISILDGHVPPEAQRVLEPGIFALCEAGSLAPTGRDSALRLHLAAPAKAVLKRIWSTWEAQRYKGQ